MSRIGKKPVAIPAGVTVQVAGDKLSVKGKVGELSLTVHPKITVRVDAGQVIVERPDDTRESRALHGLTRALVNNMVVGVDKPWEKKLEIQGVGYQAALSGKVLTLQVGFANAIKLDVPTGVSCVLADPTHITVSVLIARLSGSLQRTFAASGHLSLTRVRGFVTRTSEFDARVARP